MKHGRRHSCKEVQALFRAPKGKALVGMYRPLKGLRARNFVSFGNFREIYAGALTCKNFRKLENSRRFYSKNIFAENREIFRNFQEFKYRKIRAKHRKTKNFLCGNLIFYIKNSCIPPYEKLKILKILRERISKQIREFPDNFS